MTFNAFQIRLFKFFGANVTEDIVTLYTVLSYKVYTWIRSGWRTGETSSELDIDIDIK